MTLLIPCAGKSSRYGYSKPKWALTHPSGRLMVEEAIAGIDLTGIERICFAFLSVHQDQMQTDLKKLVKKFKLPVKTDVLIIDESNSQAETVYLMINSLDINGPIAIKDCDNYFKWKPTAKNAVACKRVGEKDDIRFLQQKSFVRDIHGFEIVEKKIISETFCVGGYSFKDAHNFIEAYHAAECEYISQIISQIQDLKFDKPVFGIDYVDGYLDWGNPESWQNYRKSYKTVFCDIDGVLLENGSAYFGTTWENTLPIKRNIEAINNLENCYVVLTTSRPEKLRKVTQRLLQAYGLKFNQLVMGLPHCQRILVNDFNDKTNPYPSAISLNLRRNSDNLDELLSYLK
jgi:hypothetical protein